MARMKRAEQLLAVDGRSPARTARTVADEHKCSLRQSWRYVRAVRKIYASRGDEDLLEPNECMRVLLARSEGAIAAPKPDYSASVKALEVYARLRGWLDRKSTVTVQGTIGLQPLPALEGASDEEIAALAAFHDARARRLASEASAPTVVGFLDSSPSAAGDD